MGPVIPYTARPSSSTPDRCPGFRSGQPGLGRRRSPTRNEGRFCRSASPLDKALSSQLSLSEEAHYQRGARSTRCSRSHRSHGAVQVLDREVRRVTRIQSFRCPSHLASSEAAGLLSTSTRRPSNSHYPVECRVEWTKLPWSFAVGLVLAAKHSASRHSISAD